MNIFRGYFHSKSNFRQKSTHPIAQCVANHLHRGLICQSTVEKFMLKKLMQKPSVKLNMTLQYCRTVGNSDVNSLETCLKTDEIFIASNCVMIFFSLSFSLVTFHFTLSCSTVPYFFTNVQNVLCHICSIIK
jgi:hypothetical protein